MRCLVEWEPGSTNRHWRMRGSSTPRGNGVRLMAMVDPGLTTICARQWLTAVTFITGCHCCRVMPVPSAHQDVLELPGVGRIQVFRKKPAAALQR